jgi:two-component system, chemotaxis family, CheB/CheR fusion protein
LNLIDRIRPEIAILDVDLPEMDGFEVARRLRSKREHADMFLIALTGYGQASDRLIGREAGFDEHFVKPVNVAELVRLLADLRGSPSRGDGQSDGRAEEGLQ